MVLAITVFGVASARCALRLHFRSTHFYNFPMLTRSSIPLVAFSLLALAACGSESVSRGTAPAGVSVEVRAVDGIAWDAREYTATATGGALTIFGANDSSLPHNLQVRDASGNDVGPLLDLAGSGSSGTLELEVTPGEYRMICLIPGHTNMDVPLTVS